jgi:hypothetical protein
MSRPEDETPVESGFLGRWAKRKQEVQRHGAAPQQAPEAAPESAPEASTEELPLPSLDSIVPGSDLTAFFQKHVPEALRTAALRKLWVTDPEIRNFIEMADYQWDFNNPDSIPGWSSSVESVDVKRMLDRVLGVGRPEAEKPTVAVSAGSEKTDLPEKSGNPDPVADMRENTESATKTGTLASEATASDHSLIQNGAVQNITKESSVYDVVRKRGGGALPS